MKTKNVENISQKPNKLRIGRLKDFNDMQEYVIRCIRKSENAVSLEEKKYWQCQAKITEKLMELMNHASHDALEARLAAVEQTLKEL